MSRVDQSTLWRDILSEVEGMPSISHVVVEDAAFGRVSEPQILILARIEVKKAGCFMVSA